MEAINSEYVEDIVDLVKMSDDALDTEDEAVDPSFDLNSSILSDSDYLVENFCENWVLHLDNDDKVSVALFSYFQLSKHDVGETQAAEMAGLMVGKSGRAIREWKSYFFAHDDSIPGSKQGKYERSGIIWGNEQLNAKAKKYIRLNSNVKGRPNLTVGSFCQWVNNTLLPNTTLEPGFPRKISWETARKWLHEQGFHVTEKKKGTFIDGHERADVVEYHQKFLRKMVGIGFLHPTNAPTEEAKSALPKEIIQTSQDKMDKTVILFHDETNLSGQ